MDWQRLVMAVLTAGAVVAVTAQIERPANVPFYTWVREDTFGGFIEDDLPRFEQGARKAQEYLDEDPAHTHATNWIGATKIYRAVRAYESGDMAAGDELFRDGLAMMKDAVSRGSDGVPLHATAGGTLVYLAPRLPNRVRLDALRRAREHYAALFKAQAAVMSRLPLHFKGELLAGVAETEFRAGDRARAIEMLDTIVKEMPDTIYAKAAAEWLKSPEGVTPSSRLVCQSCHEPGRLGAWMARQPQ